MKRLSLFILFLAFNTSLQAKTEQELLDVYEFYRQGKYSSALAELVTVQKKHLKKYKSSNDFKNALNYWKAVTLNRLQRYQLALKYFKLSKDYSKYERDYYYEYGQCLVSNLSYPLAIRQFRISIKNGFKKLESQYYIGYLQRLTKKHLESRATLQSLLNQVPKSDIAFRQSVRFEIINTELEIARNPQLSGGREVYEGVMYYIIPEYLKVVRMDNDSYLANVIQQKIIDLTNQYNKSLGEVIKIKVRPSYKFRFIEKLYNDSNVIFESTAFPVPTESPSSLINKTTFSTEYTFALTNNFSIAPILEINRKYHFTREFEEITQYDSYEVSPKVRVKAGFSYLTLPMSFSLLVGGTHHASNFNLNGDLKYFYRSYNALANFNVAYFIKSPTSIGALYTKSESVFDELEYTEPGLRLAQKVTLRWGHFINLVYQTSSRNTQRDFDKFDTLTYSATYVWPGIMNATILSIGLHKSIYSFEQQESFRGDEELNSTKVEVVRRLRNYLDLRVFFHKDNKSSLDSVNYAYKKAKFGIELQFEL